MTEYFFLLGGLVILLIGGDMMVRGAVGLAEKLAIPPIVIGLTIVSFGTSAPEMFVSLKAALSGSSGIAIGNVIGSNIANVLLVLGLPSVFMATECTERGLKRNMTVMIVLTIVFMGMMAKGSLERYDGAILLSLLGLFIWTQFRTAKEARNLAELDYHDEVSSIPSSYGVIFLLLIVGLAMLPVGASIIVDSASQIAMRWNVPEEVIGVTIVAIGTSLPELSATIMAVVRGSSSVALGNVVGSNIFNIAAIMGVTTLVRPIPVGEHILTIDMWVMLATSLLLLVLAFSHRRIGMPFGLAMSASYAIYIGLALS